MNTKLINHQIEDGTYGFDLKQQLYACRQSDSDQKNHLELIIKLLRVDLLNFNIEEVKNDFNKEDLSILSDL
ncbi:hypothetical protein GEO21_22455 [Sphingobacterium faecium]|uniref:hypothetical protein n=1 Tax=Sphingobacterium faecium TaxID=34087 RepID=UPI0012920AC1|nr:hypothetical protein [Sphingobacterium faecium]MQP30250.1 hypothetical protein [Sphingobacterium faecium]